jgi:hypothetical protein
MGPYTREERLKTMTKQNETNVVEQEEATGPQIVAIRNGAKGPGKQVVVVQTPEDAEKVKADLEPGLENGQTVIFRDLPDTQIETYESWAEKQAAVAEQRAKLDAIKSKLSPEELEILKNA